MYTRERQVLRAICEGKDPTSLNLARKKPAERRPRMVQRWKGRDEASATI